MEEKIEKIDNATQNQGNKSANGKKITSIILLVLASVLVLSMILINIVPKKYTPSLNAPDYIKVYTSSSDGKHFDKNSTEYQTIMKLYNQSFQVSVMSALVQGKLFENEKFNQKTTSNVEKSSDTTIQFCYDEPQKMIANGKEANASISNQFVVATIVVSNSAELASTTIYYNYYSGSSASSTSYYNLTTYSCQSALYDYLQTL